jgi:hypothetical protein
MVIPRHIICSVVLSLSQPGLETLLLYQLVNIPYQYYALNILLRESSDWTQTARAVQGAM